MLGSLCFSLDLNRGSTGGFSMNMWRTTCVWPCSGTSISVLKLSSINQALSLQFSLQDWIFVEARSFLETSCGSRKKKVTVGCSLAYRVDLLSYIHLTHVYIRCIYIIYKHINSKQGGALLWNYMVLTSCHTHSPARSLTQSSPAGMAIRMWRPLAFHHGHVFQVCRNMWILLQWGLMWQVQTDFCKAFARAVFLKESACIAGYVYIYSCFQKTNSSHIYIYTYPTTPIYVSVFFGWNHNHACWDWHGWSPRNVPLRSWSLQRRLARMTSRTGGRTSSAQSWKHFGKQTRKNQSLGHIYKYIYIISGVFSSKLYKFMHVYFVLSLQPPFKTINCIYIYI